MIKIETVRKITKAVIGTSVWWTVGNILDNNLNPEKRFNKIEAYIGSAAIGWVVHEQVDLYIDRKFDKLIEGWNNKDQKDEVETETPLVQDEVESLPIQDEVS